MINNKAYEAAFKTQRNNANKRDIGWYFSLETWVQWWEEQLGPDWFKKRGSHKGQYVMARKLDRGPYAPWNVEAKTTTRNVYEGSAKLTEAQVIEIYTSKETGIAAAKRYKVAVEAIYAIRGGQALG